MPQASVNKIFLPWYTLDREDLRPFVECLLGHPSKPSGSIMLYGY
jgi:hypothetical protein